MPPPNPPPHHQHHPQHHPHQQQQLQSNNQFRYQQPLGLPFEPYQPPPNYHLSYPLIPPHYTTAPDQQHQQQQPHSPQTIPFSPFEPSSYHHPFPTQQQLHSPRSDYSYHHPPTPNQDHYHYLPSPLRRSAHPKPSPPSPFVSPKPHWQNRIHSPRHPSLLPKSPYSSASSPSTQGPRSPASLAISHQPLVRGSLAQAKLRGHHFTHLDRIPSNPSKNPASPRLNRPALPKPPSHSQYALWVGNIPSDASHEELWKFFAGRAPPHNKNSITPTPVDQRIPPNSGVESIHLIARSNCAFVNYTSHQPLEQAIASCNGKPLRPMDPFCKPLLCRVRKPEDNIKSGVGAQRIGGMHRSWVKRFDPQVGNKPSTHHPSSHTSIEQHQDHHSDSTNNNRTSSTLTSTSNQSQSTTSSFLASHFPRRYFILKSYTDEDLRISVERSIWVSQTHNEPILDQAYRTSPEGVFLIFSTNQSGEFFGYAKMAGPIWKPGRRYSAPTSPTPDPGKLMRARSVSISGSVCPWRKVLDTTPDRSATTGLDNLFGVDDALTISSPRALTPVEGEKTTPMTTNENRTHFSPSRRSLPILSSQNLFNRSPLQSYSSKPPLLTNRLEDEHHSLLIRSNNMNPSLSRSRSGSNTTTGSRHSLHDSHSDDQPDLMTGRPFKVDWIRVQRLTFYRTKNLRNPFNGNREVKVSRDGTEVEPSVGQAIIDEIDKEYFRLNSSS